jgi:glutaredoxin
MAAREAYANKNKLVEYISVIDDPPALEKMLVFSNGQRKVPVIVEGERVTVGYQGKG